MKEVTYTEKLNKLDTLGIAYQRLRSCNKSENHTSTERLLLGSIMDNLSEGMVSENPDEIIDTLGKLYQRISSVNSGLVSEVKGCPSLSQRVLVSIEELIEIQL